MDNLEKIGVLWANVSKNDNKYFSGTITLNGQSYNILIFRNNKKKTEKSPDYQIFLKEERKEHNISYRDYEEDNDYIY